jgi:hypothetical protein
MLRYSIDAKKKEIRIETEATYKQEFEQIDAIFEGVAAYHFEGDIFRTIFFDIEENSPSSVLDQYAEVFEKRKKHGWPLGWNRKKEDFDAYTERLNLKIFTITSSYGMDGFVIAVKMRTEGIENQSLLDNA